MDNNLITLVAAAFAAIMGGLGGYGLSKKTGFLSIEQYRQKAEARIAKAQSEAEEVTREVAERTQHLKDRSKDDDERLKEKIKRVENIITSKNEQVVKKEARAQILADMINEENEKIRLLQEAEKEKQQNMKFKLAEKVGISMDEAKEAVIGTYISDLDRMKEERLQKYEQYLADEKIRIAKNMIVGAIQKYGNPTSVEKKSLVITVPRDDLKAKIIGHDNRNLILLEELTECDIIFNDAPNSIIISSFNLVKKHIGRETILKLLKERDVDENTVRRKIDEVKVEMEKMLIKTGREIIRKMNLKERTFPDDFYRIVGRLQFRSSYGQNIIKHSTEVGLFTIMLGAELDVNLDTCKIGGFLHDLGKAIDHEVGDPHDLLTKQIMEKYGFSWEEVHAAWTHHDAVPIETAEAMLVKAGDAVSAGRPGARQETLEKYLERVKALEEIGNSYEGVSKAFAISAGRELRINVDPRVLDDSDLGELAKTVAGEIEENVTYPGKIKVNVIRRMQSIDYVKK